MKNNLPIYGFMHCCAINNYKEIILEQVSKIFLSGLYHACERVSIGVVGRYDEEFWKQLPKKFCVDYKSSNIKEYEFPTLNLVYDKCLKKECLVWYIHTKGVAVKTSYRSFWRERMEKYVISGWKDCIRAMKKFNGDTCGCKLGVNNFITCTHYGGNFWWARSSYIRKKRSPMHLNTGRRWNAEKWLLGYDNIKNIPIDIEIYVNHKPLVEVK
jgi:hypothetical protein